MKINKRLAKKFFEEETAFLNSQDSGIDMRPIFKEQLELPETTDGMTDEEVAEAVRLMVELLARHHLYLVSTNHLSDRELYREILDKIIVEPIGLGPNPIGTLIHHECCPCDDFERWLRYYASDWEREDWQSETGEPLPEKAPLASGRDAWIATIAEAYRSQPLPG